MILNLGTPAGAQPVPPPTGTSPAQNPFVDGPADLGNDGIPLITFGARRISFCDALNIVCRIADLQWRIEDKALVITRKPAPAAATAPASNPQPRWRAGLLLAAALFVVGMLLGYWARRIVRFRVARGGGKHYT